MSEKVKYNLAVVKAQKFQDYFLWFFLICFVVLLISLCFFSCSSLSRYSGVYSCNTNICQIETMIDLNTMYELETNWKILFDGELQDFNVIEFGEFVEQDGFVSQKVTLRVSKQDYYNDQTISFSIVKGKKTFWQVFFDNLKGGDA